MGFLRFTLVIGLFCAVGFAAPSNRIALSLDKSEPYVMNLSHAGYYFTGHNKSTEGDNHRIEVYSADLSKKLKDIVVVHTVESIAPLSANQVLVIGKHFGSEWHGYYTVVTVTGGAFTSKTTEFSTEFMPEFFAGAPTALYFNEAGEAGVFQWKGSSGSMLPVKLSGPGRMAYTGKFLYVVERRDLFFFGDEKVTRIDLSTMKAESVTGLKDGISQIQYLPSGLIAVAETNKGLVHFVDAATNQVVSTVDTPSPEGLSAFGKCLAVSSQREKRVSVVQIGADKKAKVLDSWDLSALGGNLLNTRHVSADLAGKRLYVRSQDLCPSCVSSRNVVAVIENLDDVFKACE